MKTLACQHCNGTGREIDQRALGASLRLKRKRARIGLREMAERMEISAPYLSDLERGHRTWQSKYVEQYDKL